jgi:hypothetical protein
VTVSYLPSRSRDSLRADNMTTTIPAAESSSHTTTERRTEPTERDIERSRGVQVSPHIGVGLVPVIPISSPNCSLPLLRTTHKVLLHDPLQMKFLRHLGMYRPRELPKRLVVTLPSCFLEQKDCGQ